jgi:hypothetical protein
MQRRRQHVHPHTLCCAWQGASGGVLRWLVTTAAATNATGDKQTAAWMMMMMMMMMMKQLA